MSNAHNTPVGRRAVLRGGYHVQGYSKHGQEAEVHAHSLPTLRPTFLPQAEACLLFLWLRRDRSPAQVPLEQAQPLSLLPEEVSSAPESASDYAGNG